MIYLFISFLVQETVEENQESDENPEKNERQWLGKTNFVEIRSFWQIFRSFDRMWSFYILSLQVCFKYTTSDK
jgi:callose synthase